MDEMRYFGYLCPHCGKAVMAPRSVFALQAAAARIECDCARSSLVVSYDGVGYRMEVPCGLCKGSHRAEVSGQQLLSGRGVGLACPETGQLCCYCGEEKAVRENMETLATVHAKDSAETPEAFTDNVIMYEVLSEVRDIAARDGISCTCGSRDYRIRVHRGAVDITCGTCGSVLRLNAATDEDLDRLCCCMTLTIGK